MPNVPHPDKLSNDEDILKSWLENPKAAKYHASIRMRLNQPISIEIKRVRHTPGSQKHMIWMKAKGKLPDVASVHQCVAAYCSDHELLNSALVPFDLAKYTTKRLLAIKMMASLDHSIVNFIFM
jgi:acyl-CoA thioesterase II